MLLVLMQNRSQSLACRLWFAQCSSRFVVRPTPLGVRNDVPAAQRGGSLFILVMEHLKPEWLIRACQETNSKKRSG